MEGILINVIALEPGDILTASAVLVLVFGRVLLDRLAEDERNGKASSWAVLPLPESDPDSEKRDVRHAA